MKIQHLYIHVPFCDQISSYCDFTQEVYDEKIADKFLILLNEELTKRKENWDLETIYIGGGTPSILNIDQTQKLLTIIQEHTKEFNIKEFTMEAKPEDVTKKKVMLWRKYGIDRASLDVQTFNDQILKTINRQHNAQKVYDAFAIIKDAEINNISMDLTYNLPNQSNEDIQSDLNHIAQLNPNHISWYSLVMKQDVKHNHVIDIDLEAECMKSIQAKLIEQGFEHYEVCNFEKNKTESLHHLGYWMSNDWIGVGFGASSFINGTTIENIGTINNLQPKITRNTKVDIHEQVIMMGLRYKTGLNLTKPLHLKAFLHFEGNINKLIQEGYIVKENNNVFVKKEKWMVLDDILLKIF